jgi:flavin-dependent dehydrogenase
MLQAAPRARVLVVERGRYPRQKVCGEFLSAEGVSALRALARDSAELKQMIWSAPAISRARLHALGRYAEFPVEPAALSLSRFELDDALWQHAIGLGADCHADRSVSKIEGSGPFQLATSTGEFHTRAVINAAGRWSAISAPNRGRKNGAHWIGLKGHFRETSSDNAVELYFFQHGYCGVQPVGENKANACAMVRADVATSLGEVFALNPALEARSRDWQQLGEAVATAPLVFREPKPVAHSVLNAGDAAGFIDPFSGNGMTLALLSGVLAAECLSEFLNDTRDLESAQALYARRYRQELRGSFRRVAWTRMLLSLPRPFALGVLKFFDLPGVGDFFVQQTRTSANLTR